MKVSPTPFPFAIFCLIFTSGKFLQSVYRPLDRFWWRFEHLNETSSLVTVHNQLRLYAEWARFWNTSKEVLLEKSPGHDEITR
jgi:hypothetical protein